MKLGLVTLLLLAACGGATVPVSRDASPAPDDGDDSSTCELYVDDAGITWDPCHPKGKKGDVAP